VNEQKLTLPEAAHELRVSRRALREMCAAGRIGFIRTARRHWLFTRKDIDEFLERNRLKAKSVFD